MASGLRDVAAPPTTAASGAPPAGRRMPRIDRLGWKLLVLPAVVWIGVFFLFPVASILLRSFTEFRPPESGGLDNYKWFFESSANMTVLRRTLFVSGYVTLLCLVLGYPYAYLMTLTRGWVRLLLLAAVVIPLTTSPLVRTYAWLGLLADNGPVVGGLDRLGLGRPELLGNSISVTIGMMHIAFPLMVLPLYAALLRVDRRLLDAAASLGAPPRSAFFRVYLPLSAPGILAGSVLVSVLSLGFYLTPALLGSPQQTLMAPLIVTQVRQVLAWGHGGAMAFVLFVLTLMLLGLGALGSRGLLRRASAGRAEEE